MKTELNEERMLRQLRERGYDCAVAFATEAEIQAGAACGQLSIISDS